jgi:hypothetical protein
MGGLCNAVHARSFSNFEAVSTPGRGADRRGGGRRFCPSWRAGSDLGSTKGGARSHSGLPKVMPMHPVWFGGPRSASAGRPVRETFRGRCRRPHRVLKRGSGCLAQHPFAGPFSGRGQQHRTDLQSTFSSPAACVGHRVRPGRLRAARHGFLTPNRGSSPRVPRPLRRRIGRVSVRRRAGSRG